MENNILKIVSGDFEGTFSTNQKDLFTSLKDVNNQETIVNIHEGIASNIKNYDGANTTNLNDKSHNYSFSEVKNIQINPGQEWIYDNKRIFDFKDFTLTNIVVDSTWDLNGKTYGKLKGKFTGSVLNKKIEEIPEEKKEETKEEDEVTNEPKKPDDTIPEQDIDQGQGKDTDFTHEDGTQTSNDGTRETADPIVNPGNPPGETTPPVDNSTKKGCIPNVWKWIKWILLLLLLLWLLKQCTSLGKSFSCYVKKWRLENTLEDQKLQIDTLNNKIEENRIEDQPCAKRKADGFNHVDIQYFDLGQISGKVRVHYAMYDEPDMMEIFYDGELVKTTYETVKGEGYLTWNYKYKKHMPTNFMIKLSPGPAEGTRWDYSVHCPK